MKKPTASKKALRQLLARLQNGLVTDAHADEALDLLLPAVGASAATIVQRGSFANWNRQSAVPAAWEEAHTRLGHQDFSVPAVSRSPAGAWYLGMKTSTARERDVELCQKFFGLGFGDWCLTRIPCPMFGELHLVVYRAKGAPLFDEDDRAVLDLVTPHVERALAARAAIAHVTEHNDAPHAWLSYPSRRVDWSPTARAIWRARLGAISERGWGKIERALFAAAERGASGLAGRAWLRGDLSVEIAVVPPERGETRRVLALFHEGRSAAPIATPAEELLSTGERDIARKIAGGWSAAEIALARRVSEETIRTQLKTICMKLGASRVELAMLVGAEARPKRA